MMFSDRLSVGKDLGHMQFRHFSYGIDSNSDAPPTDFGMLQVNCKALDVVFLFCFVFSIKSTSTFHIEPVHNKTYNKTCVTRKDSYQPVHPSSLTRVLIYPSLESLETLQGTCDQRRLIRLRGCAG